jgi:hypothetical protein
LPLEGQPQRPIGSSVSIRGSKTIDSIDLEWAVRTYRGAALRQTYIGKIDGHRRPSPWKTIAARAATVSAVRLMTIASKRLPAGSLVLVIAPASSTSPKMAMAISNVFKPSPYRCHT